MAPAEAIMAWKFLDESGGQIRSRSGDHTWQHGEWYEIEGRPRACRNGFHAAARIYDAMRDVHGNVVAKVEAAGKCDVRNGKYAWQKMRIVRAWRFTRRDYVMFAAWAGRQVLNIFEEWRLGDGRPRKAIEAAEAWLADPSGQTGKAAAAAYAAAVYAVHATDIGASVLAAYAAYAADATASAATAAAYAAYAAYAADAAASAATAAAYAAYYAADAAASAASAACGGQDACEGITRRFEAWLQEHLVDLEEIQPAPEPARM